MAFPQWVIDDDRTQLAGVVADGVMVDTSQHARTLNHGPLVLPDPDASDWLLFPSSGPLAQIDTGLQWDLPAHRERTLLIAADLTEAGAWKRVAADRQSNTPPHCYLGTSNRTPRTMFARMQDNDDNFIGSSQTTPMQGAGPAVFAVVWGQPEGASYQVREWSSATGWDEGRPNSSMRAYTANATMRIGDDTGGPLNMRVHACLMIDRALTDEQLVDITTTLAIDESGSVRSALVPGLVRPAAAEPDYRMMARPRSSLGDLVRGDPSLAMFGQYNGNPSAPGLVDDWRLPNGISRTTFTPGPATNLQLLPSLGWVICPQTAGSAIATSYVPTPGTDLTWLCVVLGGQTRNGRRTFIGTRADGTATEGSDITSQQADNADATTVDSAGQTRSGSVRYGTGWVLAYRVGSGRTSYLSSFNTAGLVEQAAGGRPSGGPITHGPFTIAPDAAGSRQVAFTPPFVCFERYLSDAELARVATALAADYDPTNPLT